MIVNENKLIVPKGVRYVDESDYTLEDFQFPHILDKKIPGCGYTEYCLRSPLPTILCSPRKILLENKEAQHIGEVFYFRNEFDIETDTGKDLTKIDKASVSKENFEAVVDNSKEISELIVILNEKLSNYLSDCSMKGLTPKILVTYDSFRLVKEYLVKHNLFQYFYVVIDEFQSIFTDSRFKSTTEMEFVNQLQDVQRVCFVSATPMIDKYLKQVDEFKDLPYFEFDWSSEDPLRTITPDLKVRVAHSLTGQALKIINEYKSGNFEEAIVGGNKIYSTEAVFYVNSVTNIISIIRKAELKPEECNILCANTPQNQKRVKSRLGRKFSIGSVPLKGEPHKMFTFCTRTVYLGADFYSFCARSFILSDANIDSLAVDITLDLPQILGRQRRPENPWKNRAELYYKTLGKANELTEEAFENIIKLKLKKTNDLLLSFSLTPDSAKHSVAETYKRDAISTNYQFTYTAVNEHGGNDLIPCLNNLVLIAERRAFDIQQKDYKDRFTVFNTIVDTGLINTDITSSIQTFLRVFESLSGFKDKMRYLCDSSKLLSDIEIGVILDQIPLTYKNYYMTLGPERLYSLGYDITKVSREYSDMFFDRNSLKESIYNTFHEGDKIAMSDIKIMLKDLYKSLGYNKSPMATDLEEFFELSRTKISTPEGKYRDAFKLLKKK